MVCGRLDGPSAWVQLRLYDLTIPLRLPPSQHHKRSISGGGEEGEEEEELERFEVEMSLLQRNQSMACNLGLLLSLSDGSAVLLRCDRSPSTPSSQSTSLMDVISEEFPTSLSSSPSAIAFVGEWRVFRFVAPLPDNSLSITSVSLLVAGEAGPIEFNIGHVRISSSSVSVRDVPRPPMEVQAKVSWRLESSLEGDLIGDVHLFWRNSTQSLVHHVDIYDVDEEDMERANKTGQASWIARSFCEAVTLFAIKFDERKGKRRRFKLVSVGQGGPTAISEAVAITVNYC